MHDLPKRTSGRVAGRKIKVTDVARVAGVSASTVDRVLNSRIGVKPGTVRRVEEAMASLGYSVNSLAARLATPIFGVDVVLPLGGNPFFEMLRAEFRRQGERLADYGCDVRVNDVDVFDTASLAAFLREYRPPKARVLIIVAHDAPEVRHEIDVLMRLGVPVITLVSDNIRSSRKAFVGIDNFSAGRTAGALMARFLAARDGTIGVIVGHLGLRDHLDRRSGFEQIIAQLKPKSDIRLLGASRDKSELAAQIAVAAFETHRDIVGIYNVGAANEGLFASLRSLPNMQHAVVISHELNAVTRQALLDGTCDALIVQDVVELARRALDTAAKTSLPLPQIVPDGHMSIGIMIKENLPWLAA